jgi:hypothetical protein
MATETTGQVGFVKVNASTDSNFALIQVLDASTTPPTPELFFIWFTPADRFTPTGAASAGTRRFASASSW